MRPAAKPADSPAQRFVDNVTHVSPVVVSLGQGAATTMPIGQLEELIGTDPEFSLRVLALANSAFYSQQHEITELRGALVVLGSTTVHSLAAGLLVRGLIDKSSAAAEAVWRHSLAVGVAAELLAGVHRAVDAKQAYVAGLLHDIGLLVTQQVGGADVEIDASSHAALGAEVAELMGLSPVLAAAIRHHHNDPLGNAPLEATLAAAELVADQAGYALGADQAGSDAVVTAALEHLELLPKDLSTLAEHLPHRIDTLSAIFEHVSS